MKIAVISDIHGNVDALSTFLEDVATQNVDTIICLGDLVGYGPYPNEVISLIRKKHILCIKGNYDTSVVDNEYSYIRETSINSFSLPWTVNELTEENRLFLQNLPSTISLTIEDKKLLFVHGSPYKINEYLLKDADNTINIMNSIKEDILFCAHTHLPGIKKFDDKLYVNCGSIGKPKIGRPNITYCLFNIDAQTGSSSEIKEIPYDFRNIVKHMNKLGFPKELVKSFQDGLE
ncbi:metallophosphoesterase family protein [Clostridium sp. C2-6-12]|uniref:metallophosphoesterase family protein n=1 Tax=Clostridium sp. C2-6-12 TaxID=2698832 RepID=UPI00136C462B|nr:metallophosphoesterase family protein [Clostridium sp. C2-6-12]